MSKVISEVVKLYDELISVLKDNIGKEVKYVWGSHKATKEGLRIIVNRRMKLKKADIMGNPRMFEAIKQLEMLEKEELNN